MDKIIRSLSLDLSDLPEAGESRAFSIIGDTGAEFIFEIKDNTTGYYYNFVTNTFQAAKDNLQKSITQGFYKGFVFFPAVTGSDDKYDIYLHAKPGTKHTQANEVRFVDGTLDINSSTGSNSLIIQKVIYQYSNLTLTIQGQSLNSTVTGTFGKDSSININRGGSSVKKAFSFEVTSDSIGSYKILKQPTLSDILSYKSIVIGSAPEKLPGENIYPAVTNTDTVNGAVSSGVKVVMDADVADKMKVGDRITGNAALNAATVTVVALDPDGDNAKEFSMSEAIGLANDLEISFSNQKNYRWPVDNINNVLIGNSVLSSISAISNTLIAPYEDSFLIFPGTEKEELIIKNQAPALDNKNLKATLENGVVTVQPGSIVFNQQQLLEFAGETVNIGGYSHSSLLAASGYNVNFTNMAVKLTPVTTTTTSAVSASTTVSVASVNGIIPSLTTVSGIGIDPSTINPTVVSRSVTSGPGDITLSAAQTLESGITLALANSSQVATITGDIEILKAGTTNQTIYFDLEKILSIA